MKTRIIPVAEIIQSKVILNIVLTYLCPWTKIGNYFWFTTLLFRIQINY